MRAAPLTLPLAALLRAAAARADDRPADPSNYRAVLATLRPGDTMRLAPGAYGLLNVSGLNGRADAPIVIAGPASGAPAVFNADRGPCCNTVELRNSSHVVLRGLTVDGGGVAGAFGVSAGGGAGNLVHHVTVEGCTFLRHDASQQTVAISTKTPTWGWVIRGNVIRGAGTGLYLGNSDGSSPFVGGLIEGNLVEDTVGYNMEIKYQRARPAVTGLPTDPQTTVIRYNVWVKTDRASPDGDRPNVLVGGFPDTGAGATDRYEVYGNVFLHNPRESLFQASGRVTVHDNLFVDVAGTALLLRNHDLPLRQAFVYRNTFYSVGRGVVFGSAAAQGSAAVGNLIFSASPLTGTAATLRDNVTDTVANAAMYVASPSLVPGMMDFYPRPGRCQGAALDLSPFAGDRDVGLDFNCAPRGGDTFRGAYAGEGSNPGWRVTVALRPPACGGATDGGVADAAVTEAGVDAASDAAGDGGPQPDDAEARVGAAPPAGGCGCATPARAYGPGAWMAVGAALARRRRRGRA